MSATYRAFEMRLGMSFGASKKTPLTKSVLMPKDNVLKFPKDDCKYSTW